MDILSIAAPAKINWRLAVTGRRADGYHLLIGLMQSISLHDTVHLRLSDVDSCRVTPPLPLGQQDNLAFKAWQLLKSHLKLKHCLEIVIEKRIPVGGGLGGGSADAAAVLKGANELLDLRLGLDELTVLGRPLGADVPFCLLGGLAKAAGTGEILAPLTAPPPLRLLLANPGFAVPTTQEAMPDGSDEFWVPTAQVFKHFRESGKPFADANAEEKACEKLAQALAQGDIAAINNLLANDLAPSARQLYPQISLLEQQMRNLGLAPLLSGSGGTVFAIIENCKWQMANGKLKDLNYRWQIVSTANTR